jgi:hypothetical protein
LIGVSEYTNWQAFGIGTGSKLLQSLPLGMRLRRHLDALWTAGYVASQEGEELAKHRIAPVCGLWRAVPAPVKPVAAQNMSRRMLRLRRTVAT